ncbi:unnamed protein product [Protopolystoma xenopodis]|uniref:Uncharacterized protein n=1 Tax=Protopolystoma xenopodis TaxID=117903 RepID=A0A3S5B2P6_9PLAT|nr:unnamed protein product [Protopolystoma xenopodis]
MPIQSAKLPLNEVWHRKEFEARKSQETSDWARRQSLVPSSPLPCLANATSRLNCYAIASPDKWCSNSVSGQPDVGLT